MFVLKYNIQPMKDLSVEGIVDVHMHPAATPLQTPLHLTSLITCLEVRYHQQLQLTTIC
jgi:hypothetical protein